jgi:hypothetical protein
VSDPGDTLLRSVSEGRGKAGDLTAKEYIEAVAAELSRARKGGLVLSPADTALALSWHAARVPVSEVRAELRRLTRPPPRARGTVAPPVSLQAIARVFEARLKRAPRRAAHEPRALGHELRVAARDPRLAARAAWQALAEAADELLARDGGEGYWTAAVRALKDALRELPRSSALQAGAALRERIAPRPRNMSRRRYQRSLQLMLLSAASERIGLPPRAFLL